MHALSAEATELPSIVYVLQENSMMELVIYVNYVTPPAKPVGTLCNAFLVYQIELDRNVIVPQHSILILLRNNVNVKSNSLYLLSKSMF